MPDRELVSGNRQAEDLQFEAGLRPRRLADFTGQSKLKANLSIAIEAARVRGEATRSTSSSSTLASPGAGTRSSGRPSRASTARDAASAHSARDLGNTHAA